MALAERNETSLTPIVFFVASTLQSACTFLGTLLGEWRALSP
jgi:hypothetical protein